MLSRQLALLLAGSISIALLVSCGGRSDGDKRNEQPSDSQQRTSESVQQVVKTKRLEIVGDDGNARAVLSIVEGGRPSLALMDSDGRNRAWLFLSPDGSPNLVLIDSPRVALLDSNGEIRSTYRLDREGSPFISLLDKEGKVRSLLRLGRDGSPATELYDTAGKVTWSAP